jgi:hypothetical protein
MDQSRVKDVDDAFNLFLVIIGIVSSIYNSHYELLFSGDSPERVANIIIRFTVIPLLVLTFIWIGAKLIRSENYAIFLKLVDWMMALNLTLGLLFMYFRDTGYIRESRFLETYVQIIMIFLVPIFVFSFVVPRYKEMYPDATFFVKNWSFILSAILAELLWYSILQFATGSFA